MRKSGRRTRVRGVGAKPKRANLSGLLLVATVLSFNSSLVAGAERVARGGAGETRITLRVFNYARFPRETLARALDEAGRILANIGIETNWLDCVSPRPEGHFDPVCKELPGPTEFVIVLYAKAGVVVPVPSREVLGFARLSPAREGPPLAGIFADRVQKVVERDRHSPALVLGVAIAHEIGHLLMDSDSHSPTGLMRGKWTPNDLRRAARAELRFTRAEVRHIRAQAQALTTRHGSLLLALR